MIKNLYSEFIYLRTYSRWLEDQQRRETWEETVNRYRLFFLPRVPETLQADFERAINLIRAKEIMPSMRCLWTAGKALEEDNIAGYNCSFVVVDHPKVFAEILYILLHGTGVGFSTERQWISELPEIPKTLLSCTDMIIVQDSKLGWAEAYESLINYLYAGKIPMTDYSLIRPAGARLKTFGGRASGSEPLIELFEFTIRKFKAAEGRRLKSIEVYDIVCKIANCVVVGGVRRSATINLSNLSDDRMRRAKEGEFWIGNPQRSLSNNSVAYTEKPEMNLFLEEWISLMKSGTGERGIFNREAAKNSEREFNSEKIGTNPCFFGDTLIETVKGKIKIKDITEPVFVYSMDSNGKLCIRKASASWKTKENARVIKIKVKGGNQLIVTPDHKIYVQNKGWVEAQYLKAGDPLILISRTRRGSAYSGIKLSNCSQKDIVMEHRLVYAGVTGEDISNKDIHHKDGNTYNNHIENLEALPHKEHSRLTAHTQPNNHQLQDEKGRFCSPSEGKKGKTIIPLPDHLKANLVNQGSCRVISIEEAGYCDVYDIQVEDTHCVIANGIVAHNCGEIILNSKQFCNLTEVIIKPDDCMKILREKVLCATLLGCLQATLTDFNFLSPEWRENTERERLLGVSLTGLQDNQFTNIKSDAEDLFNNLSSLRSHARIYAKYFAKALNINVPTAITCVKPSGTVSQLVGCSSGLHTAYAKYYLRRVRVNAQDPLAYLLLASDVPVHLEVGQTRENASTLVFDFPLQVADTTVTKSEVTALEQLEYWKILKEAWCDHNPSCTIYVKEDEWLEVGAWVYRNWALIGGLSFLPDNGGVYELAPYEEISKEKYEQLVKAFPTINFDLLKKFEKEDNTEGAKSYACIGDKCEIV